MNELLKKIIHYFTRSKTITPFILSAVFSAGASNCYELLAMFCPILRFKLASASLLFKLRRRYGKTELLIKKEFC